MVRLQVVIALLQASRPFINRHNPVRKQGPDQLRSDILLLCRKAGRRILQQGSMIAPNSLLVDDPSQATSWAA